MSSISAASSIHHTVTTYHSAPQSEILSSPITTAAPISRSWAIVEKIKDPAHALNLSRQDCHHFDIQDYSPNIHTLDLSDNDMLFLPPKTVTVLSKLPLQAVFMHGINNGQEALVNLITKELTPPIFNKTLSILDLSGYPIKSTQLKSLLLNLPTLNKLGMHNSKLNDLTLNTLLKNKSSQLKYIDASNNLIKEFKMLESWPILPIKTLSPKKLTKQFSFSTLSISPLTWIISLNDHTIFQPPIPDDEPALILDLRDNPLTSNTLEALSLRFDKFLYETIDSTFNVFYNTKIHTYILTNRLQPAYQSWIKA
ncbi:MAG: hypothetical protein WCG10_01915 [Chlamydiota bacterium]